MNPLLTPARLCRAILQGHTSLVGQLQMQGTTLVTGGSDGSVRVWSLLKMAPIHRLAAHDNSVTSLQFDHNRIVSGGSDGRVKVWDTKTGQLVRELSQPADAVWRVAFEDEKAVIMASRNQRTIMEVWSFAPDASRPALEDRSDTPISAMDDAAEAAAIAGAAAAELAGDCDPEGDEDEVAIRSPRPRNRKSGPPRLTSHESTDEAALDRLHALTAHVDGGGHLVDVDSLDGDRPDVEMGEGDDEDDDDDAHDG